MTTPRVIGLDLSLTATGIAYGDGHGVTVVSAPPRSLGDERLVHHAREVRVHARGANLAVLEDLPMHAHGAGITGMVHGVARLMLRSLRVPYALLAPATLKKFATGSGAADKDTMAAAARYHAGMEFGTSDECDAWWLRAAGMQHCGHPIVDLPPEQVAALLPARWPKRLPHEEPL